MIKGLVLLATVFADMHRKNKDCLERPMIKHIVMWKVRGDTSQEKAKVARFVKSRFSESVVPVRDPSWRLTRISAVPQVSLGELGCILVARSVAVNDTPAPLDPLTVRWESRLSLQ